MAKWRCESILCEQKTWGCLKNGGTRCNACKSECNEKEEVIFGLCPECQSIMRDTFGKNVMRHMPGML